jgi:hypothetical protein
MLGTNPFSLGITTFMDDYSDLLEKSIESLGTEGYCDIAAEVLLESFPDAQLYRLTDVSGERFGHVFLVVGERAVDITGFTRLAERAATAASENLHPEPVSLEAVRAYFRGHGRTAEERRIVRIRFVDYVAQNPKTFGRDA